MIKWLHLLVRETEISCSQLSLGDGDLSLERGLTLSLYRGLDLRHFTVAVIQTLVTQAQPILLALQQLPEHVDLHIQGDLGVVQLLIALYLLGVGKK